MSTSYTTKDIKQLTDRERIRRSPHRTLGKDPYTTAVREIVDNALDEVARGYANRVDLVFRPDGSIEVTDNGRGVPVDFDPDVITPTGGRGVNGIVKALGTIGSGANYDHTGNQTAGVHGEGGAATNFVSTRFDVTVTRGGKRYTQQFLDGIPGHFEGEKYDPRAPFTPKESEKLAGEKTTNKTTGTTIRFTPDRGLAPDAGLNTDEVIHRAHIAARLRDGMTLTVTQDGDTTTFTGPYGTPAVAELADVKPALNLAEKFTYTSGGTTREATISVALAPNVDPKIISTVNTVLTPDHGPYVNYALRGVAKGIASQRVYGLSRKRGEDYPDEQAFTAAMAGAITLTLNSSPRFDSQEKSSLSWDRAMCNALAAALEKASTTWAVDARNQPALKKFAHAALEVARREKRVQHAKESARNASKAAKGSTLNLPDKYLPCERTGPGSGAELHLVEGDSAIGTFRAARDATFQAAFPLRGRAINAYRSSVSRVRKNAEFAGIEALLGTGIGANCDPDKCQFDRIILTTDADPDGAGIAASLIALFVSWFPGIVERGKVYVSSPPLFIVTGAGDHRMFCMDEQERDSACSDLEDHGVKHIEVQRCKGLGEMVAEDFADTVLNPETRMLKKIMFDPGRDMGDLETTYGTDSAARREWITARVAEGYLGESRVDVIG